MAWYYAEGNQRRGPMTDDEFQAAVSRGTVAPDTLVWREGMKDWAPFSTVGYQGAPADVPPLAAGYVRCAECGRSFPPDEVIAYAGQHVCGSCKSVFFQRVKEGAALPGEFEYAGFWIRFAARILDTIIMFVVSLVVQLPFQGVIDFSNPAGQIPLLLVYYLISLGLTIGYPVIFLGKYGATPGKMAAGIKVVRPDGAAITYLRALGRFFGEMIMSSGIGMIVGLFAGLIVFAVAGGAAGLAVGMFSGMLGAIVNYLAAAFDDEKRALHDRICDTRVIKAR